MEICDLVSCGKGAVSDSFALFCFHKQGDTLLLILYIEIINVFVVAFIDISLAYTYSMNKTPEKQLRQKQITQLCFRKLCLSHLHA